MANFYASYPFNGSSGSGGTVTSVGLADGSTTPIFNISGSPVTGSGTLTFTLAPESAHAVLAGPTSGGPAQPTFRVLVASDLPAGTGTVTSFSFVNANGVSGVVTNPTTTPALTLTLGAITPSSVAATGTVTGSNLSGTNTGDVTIGTANGLSLAGQVLSLGLSSTSTTGALSSTDWNTFNSKQASISTFTAPANQFLTGFTSPNTFTAAQPAFSNLSGNITAAQMLALPSGDIYVGNGSNQPAAVAASGDVAISNTGVVTIQPNVVTNSKLAQMAAGTIKGNNTGSTANALDLTGVQVTAMLSPVVGDTGAGGTAGIVPAPPAGSASAGDFLSANGTWTFVDQSQSIFPDFSLVASIPQLVGGGHSENTFVLTHSNGKQYALVSGGGVTGTLELYDISDQTKPVLVNSGNFAGSYNITGAVISGSTYAFIPSSGASTLIIVNITNPTSWTTVSTTTITNAPGSIYSAVYAAGYVYCATQNKGLTVLDAGGGLSGGTLSVPVQSFQEGGTTNKSFGVAISGNYVYTTNYQTTFPATVRYLKTWALTGAGTLNVPSLANTYTISGGPTGTSTKPLGLTVSANGLTAFVSDGNQNVIDIIDVTTPTSPNYLAYITPTYTVNSGYVAVSSGNYLFIPSGSASNPGAIDMYDITARSTPIKVDTIFSPTNPDVFGGIAISGGYIFAGAYGSSSANGPFDVFSMPQLSVVAGNLLASTATLQSLTPNTALISSASDAITSSVTTATELSYVHGVTSGIQAQINSITGSGITSLTTDVVATGPGAAVATIQPNVVTNSKLAQMPSLTIKGNNTGGTANASDLTVAQVNAILPVFTSTLNGLVPLSGGGTSNFLRADGTWQAPAGTGTVTSVAMTVPSFLSVSGSPVTSSGTLAVTLSGTALPILNGGTGATTASAAFNNLSPMTTAGDLIYGGASGAGTRLGIGTTGQVLTVSGGNPVWSNPAGTGTVTSVALADGSTSPIYSISGSPVTSSGTLTFTLSTQSANKVLAGPASGSAAQPTFRSLNVADMTITSQVIASTNIDWSTGNLFTQTLGSNKTFTFSNAISGQTLIVRLTNTSSNFTVTWPTVRWTGGAAPTMSPGAVSDVYTFVYDGSNYYGSAVQNMS